MTALMPKYPIRDALIATAGAGITFSCVNKLGATLLLRAGSTRVNIRDNDHIDEYIRKHIDSWYEYAWTLGYRERQAPEGSIMLIKGCDKTSSWAHATFAERSREASVSFSGGYFNVGGAVHLKGSWIHAVSAIYREAPLGERPAQSDTLLLNEPSTIASPSPLMVSNDVPITAIFPPECVYSVFVRVYRIRRRAMLGMVKLLTVQVDGQPSRSLLSRLQVSACEPVLRLYLIYGTEFYAETCFFGGCSRVGVSIACCSCGRAEFTKRSRGYKHLC
jgi:hypothetical protein